MTHSTIILEKILLVFLVMAVGVVLKRAKLISDSGERDLSRLMIDFTWPAVIFSSITASLTTADLRDNLALPLLAVGLHLVGFLLGCAVALPAKFSAERRRAYLFQASISNFFAMAYPFAQLFFPRNGLALLTVSNLGSTVVFWTLGVRLTAGRFDPRTALRSLLSPAMVATVSASLLVAAGLNASIPRLIRETVALAGQPTLLLALMVAGMQIDRLGFKSLKFDPWNLLVGLTRNFLAPGAVFLLCLLFREHLTREAIVVTLLVAVSPSSMNSITLALRYDAPAEPATEAVLFTHLLALPSMLFFLSLIERFFPA